MTADFSSKLAEGAWDDDGAETELPAARLPREKGGWMLMPELVRRTTADGGGDLGGSAGGRRRLRLAKTKTVADEAEEDGGAGWSMDGEGPTSSTSASRRMWHCC